jgi:solute carrier family 25 protein 16
MEQVTRGPMPMSSSGSSSSSSGSGHTTKATQSQQLQTTDHSPAKTAMMTKMSGMEAVGGARTATTTPRKEVDKRSLDYLMRSGLAGGLAGCAVRP